MPSAASAASSSPGDPGGPLDEPGQGGQRVRACGFQEPGGRGAGFRLGGEQPADQGEDLGGLADGPGRDGSVRLVLRDGGNGEWHDESPFRIGFPHVADAGRQPWPAPGRSGRAAAAHAAKSVTGAAARPHGRGSRRPRPAPRATAGGVPCGGTAAPPGRGPPAPCPPARPRAPRRGLMAPAWSGSRRCRASTVPAAVTTSSVTGPSWCRTVTCCPACPGGTEYRFPCQDTSACADHHPGVLDDRGERPGGSGRSGSAAASSPTRRLRAVPDPAPRTPVAARTRRPAGPAPAPGSRHQAASATTAAPRSGSPSPPRPCASRAATGTRPPRPRSTSRTSANDAVRSPDSGWQTVDMRSNRHRRVTPPSRSHDPVQRRDQVRLLLRLRQHPAPRPRVRQRPDQQVRVLPLPPRRRRVRQLNPVPLGLLARRVIDHRELVRRPGRRARLAPRTQPPLRAAPA